MTPVRESIINKNTDRLAFTLVELLVVIAIIGVLVGLLLPAVQSVRASARQTACSNKLRQIALGVLGYEAAHKHFPNGINSITDSHQPSASWLASILPFIELTQLAQVSQRQFDMGIHPVHGPHVALQTPIQQFSCPSDPRSGSAHFTHENRLVALTSFVGVCGTNYKSKDGMFFQNSRKRSADIKDGLSQSLMIGERPPSADKWYGWWYAGHGQEGSGSPDMLLGVAEINDGARYAESCPRGPYEYSIGDLQQQCDLFHFWSLHPNGGLFGFADGSTHFFSYSGDSTLLPSLATISGGEVVDFSF